MRTMRILARAILAIALGAGGGLAAEAADTAAQPAGPAARSATTVAAPAAASPVPVYTQANAPVAPQLEELPLRESVSQYGITWTFAKPVRVGRFVTGDWYVVGPVTVSAISPAPKDGRNGSCLNVTATREKAGFDSRMLFSRYDAALFLAPPITLQPGDTLLSSISLGENEVAKVRPMLWRLDASQRSPIRTVAALTCLPSPVPADALRPAYCGRGQKVYLARDLKRELLPKLSREGVALVCSRGSTEGKFTIQEAAGWFQRPWLDLVMDEFGAPVENMPVYGQQFCRAVGLAGLLLCLDFTPEEKEPLLLNFVQLGIDLWGLAGHGAQPTPWNAIGGHANGRKWPIVFAGLMLSDAEMREPAKKYTYLRFSEDTQTMFGPSWTGAKVVWAGHVGAAGNPKYPDWGAYEHLPPAEWKGNTGEAYRRNNTSNAWVGEALAARMMHAEKLWNHDAFFAYVDRWMTEDDAKFLPIIKQARGADYDKEWSRQGAVWDPFVKELWRKYRDNLPPSPDGTPTPKSTETWK